ncbi:peptidylprolyl isomerase [Roseomonas nepalensis]|uniref:Parvulin-like PPIase n=1 Tax=Muricoccus nepalensis TaxID=1854500 RepID=A0A502GBN1_9PROT|nr:peptidylprolyl isomerase [Roseomonas nepalensis]TPG58113.1 peptidylprolyl isomerase [Roseomonas nepalensis]
MRRPLRLRPTPPAPAGLLLGALLALPLGALPPAAGPATAQVTAQAGSRQAPPRQAAPAAPPEAGNRILAIVNGDVVTESEVQSRARLFALNIGLQPGGDLLTRLRPQIMRQLIEERLRLQEIQRRRIPVGDDEVADAIGEIEKRNNLPSGGLRAQLRAAGVEPRVLYDQLRAQIGWSRFIRALLGPNAEPSEAAVKEAVAAQEARTGQPEYLLSEIFVPVEDPSSAADTRRFVDDVIGRLRQGLPFPIAATQFSQSQTALQGGDLGWVSPESLDPAVAAVVQRMPPGAVSNAIEVPGGFQVVALRQKRETGRENATMVTIRQAFLPFTSALDPQNPTEQQRAQLARAQAVRGGCDAVEAAARAANSPRPADPGGAVRLDTLNPPALRQLVSGLAPGRTSQPIVTSDGILVIAVCTRETRNLAQFTPEQAKQQILRDRAENLSRQQIRDLRRRATIEMRG